jgi:hypothetical protein
MNNALRSYISHKMEGETIRKVIVNLRSPVDAKIRIRFTSRCVLFLIRLFESKRIDTIALHHILMQLAHASGCFREDIKYINLKDLIVFLYSNIPVCISVEDIQRVGNMFSVDNDSNYKEVEDMKIIIDSINAQ